MSDRKTFHRRRTPRERVFEIIPAALSWSTIVGGVVLSFWHPAWVAVFIIIFDTYWVLKAINTSFHLLSSFNRYKRDLKVDWLSVLEKREPRDWSDIYHAVLLPFVNESEDLIRTSIMGVLGSSYPKDRIIIILGAEERAGEYALRVASNLQAQFQNKFAGFLTSVHPEGLSGEIRGKSANTSYAAEKVLLPWLVKNSIPLDKVVISNLDCDTIIHPQYLARVTYEWLLAPNPHRRSYQPITLYNNNMWDSPALIRVVAVASSFWQFMESSRPDRLRTFSSHSMSFKTLMEVGYWKKEIVNEDGFIFWQCYLHFDGDYQVAPVFIPVSMDTCLAPTYKETLLNQYRQKRRWAYNVEYWPHLVPKLLSNKKIPLRDRLNKFLQYLEGNYTWAVASIVIATMGFLPAFLGDNFVGTVFGFNLPYATRLLMNIAVIFLIFSVYINMVLLPPRPPQYKSTKTLAMFAQWILVPLISIVWGSFPALEAQARLALGKYMEFWVTPKERRTYTMSAKFPAVTKTQKQLTT